MRCDNLTRDCLELTCDDGLPCIWTKPKWNNRKKNKESVLCILVIGHCCGRREIQRDPEQKHCSCTQRTETCVHHPTLDVESTHSIHEPLPFKSSKHFLTMQSSLFLSRVRKTKGPKNPTVVSHQPPTQLDPAFLSHDKQKRSQKDQL